MKTRTDNRSRFAAAALALLLAAAPARAAFEDLGFGARVPGMGDAFTGVADDISSVYYNPAGLASLERPKVIAAHSMFYSGLSDGSNLGLSAAAFAFPLSNGRGGTLAGLWQQFSLSGVYAEKTAQVSWGYRFDRRSVYEKFSIGASLKYLSHGFTRLDETYNAVENDLMQNGNTDPVLAGANSRAALDADVGVLYRLTKRWTLGGALLNAMQANVAFSSGDKDKIPMKTRLGASYKSLWLVLAADARLQKGPDGKADKQFIFAAEKVFPSLDRGDVGVRASLGAGDREFKQATAGLSYKIQKIQLDYGFSLPIGTVKETAGNHRVALTYHFGSATQTEIAEAELLEQYKRLREAKDYKSPRETASLNDPRLADIKELIKAENYYAANKLLLERANELLPDSTVVGLTKRLSTVAAFWPSLAVEGRQKNRWEQLLSGGVKDFLNGADQRAMKQLAYAQSLNQQDSALANFLDRVGEITRVTPDKVPADFSRGWAEYKLTESDELYTKKRYSEALRKLDEMLELEPNDLLALKKSGSCNYMLGSYARAAYDWEKASRLETDPLEKAKVSKMIEEARIKQGKASSWQPPVSGAAIPGVDEKEETKAEKDAREIEKLYQLGADHYAKGAYGKAADTFRKILTIDPQNTQAKKALERIIRLSR
ncbi:MAG: type IX secretion system membrane protein PorP/SprF [Elusimicrobiales bacterium]|nr:type IX secretion system membrane protein PorP/SprF [Elusimicrobiales bacterium]